MNEVTTIPSAGATDDLMEKLVARIRERVDDPHGARVVGVGVSLAAPVHSNSGQTSAPAAPPRTNDAPPWSDWQLMRVREHLRFGLGWPAVPVALDNDANLSALAQFVWGAARPGRFGSFGNIVYLEWSRGIGAGLILNGRLYRGDGVAGEIGHTVVANRPDCTRCGNRGCLETIAGWEALVEPTGARATLGDLTEALRQARDDPDGPVADRFRDAAWTVGQVLGPTVHLLNPQVVIIGGDVGGLGYDVIRPHLLRSLRRHTMRPALADATVVATTPLSYAALRGAIALILVDDPTAVFTYLQKQVTRRQ